MSNQFNSGRLYGRGKMGAPLCLQWRDGVCFMDNYCFNRHFYNETDFKKPAWKAKYSGESSFIFSSPLVVKTKTVTESKRKEEVDLETGRRRSWIEDTSRDLIDITGQASPVGANQKVSRLNDTSARKLEALLDNKVENCQLQDEDHGKIVTVEANEEGTNSIENKVISLDKDHDKTITVEANGESTNTNEHKVISLDKDHDKTITVEANDEDTNTNKNKAISLGQTASVTFGKIYVSAPFAMKPFEKYLSTEQIKGHFEQFGHIVAIEHPIDKASRQKEGFFFVTYEDDKIINNLVSVGSTIIEGIELIIRPFYVDYGKIFVGAPFILKPLDKYISTDQIYGHFGQFGNIISIYQPINRATQQKEGYFFVTFDNEEVANNLINTGTTFINGFRLRIEKTRRRANNICENESSGKSIGHDTRGYHESGFNSDQGGIFKSEDQGFGFDHSRGKGSSVRETSAGRYNQGKECERYRASQYVGGREAGSSYSGRSGVGLGEYRGDFGERSSSVVCDDEMFHEQRCIWESIKSSYKMGEAFNTRAAFRYMPY